MSNKKVCILFNSKEETIEIDLNKIKTYPLFLEKIHELIKENDPSKTYQLMGINTSEQYIILNDGNYTTIMNENIPNEDLKLFLTKLEKIPEPVTTTTTTTSNNGVIKSIVVVNNADDDDDFIIEKEEEKRNDKEDDNTNETMNDKNKFDNNNNIINSNKIENEQNEQKKEAENQGDDNLNSYKSSYSAEFDKIKNYTPLSTLNLTNNENSNNYLSQISLTNMDTFSSESCSICGNQLFAIKYICCLCENAILCPQCESLHLHPCFKYKTQFLSNIKDIYKFMKQFYSFKLTNSPKNPLSKIFQKDYEIRISPMTDTEFSIRTNKDVVIPIKIRNLSKDTIYSNNFEIVAKNNKEINICYESEKNFSIEGNGEYILKMMCYGSTKNCEEKVNFCLFSKDLKIRNKHNLNFDLTIEVNEDEEEENLNKKIGNDFILYSKKHKYDALEIMNELKMKDNPSKVFKVLIDCKWDKDNAMKILKKNKK